jgi:hypothetical protein
MCSHAHIPVKPDGSSARFYTDVDVAPVSKFVVSGEIPVPPMHTDELWTVLLGECVCVKVCCFSDCVMFLFVVFCLDDRGMLTPFGNLLCVPNEALALGIAGEWAMQSDRIKPGRCCCCLLFVGL